MTDSKRRRLGAIAGFAAAAGVGGADAAMIAEFTYHASIFFIEDFDDTGDEFDLQLGDPISMSYVIDLETPDLIASPSRAAYEVLGASILVGGYAATSTFENPLRVDVATTFDEFDLFASGFLGSDTATVEFGGFGALADDSIPMGFELDSFSERFISYSFQSPGNGAIAVIHSYDMRLIPGGGAMATVAIGGLWFGGRRRHAPGRARRSIHSWDAFATHTQALP